MPIEAADLKELIASFKEAMGRGSGAGAAPLAGQASMAVVLYVKNRQTGQIMPLEYDDETRGLATSASGHNFLSVTHGDTTAATVVRGDIVTGQGASATWSRLALGASGTIPRSNGTDLAYTTATYPNTVAQYDLLYATSTNVIGVLGAAAQTVLTGGVSGLPTYISMAADGRLLIGSSAGQPAAATLTGTASQITVTNGSNSITLSLPGGAWGGFANPSASLGLTAVNGSATTAMRSDGAPALSVSIAPTWTGAHTFNNAAGAVVQDGSGGQIASIRPWTSSTAYGALYLGPDTIGDNTYTIIRRGSGSDGTVYWNAASAHEWRIANATNILRAAAAGLGIGASAPATGTNVGFWNLGTVWTQAADSATITAIDWAAGDTRLVVRSETGKDVWIGNGTVACDNIAHSATNYERGAIYWNSNVLEIGVITAGTGASRVVKIGSNGTSTLAVYLWCAGTNRIEIDSVGNVITNANQTVIATNATDGFLYIPSCAGTPTGVPNRIITGSRPMIWDSTNKKLYVYDGSWLGGTVPGIFV